MSRAPDFLDEIRQQLRERLLVGDPPRVAEYGGRGALGAWVRVAAVRLALNVRKESRRREQLRAPADRGGASPETLAGAAEYRAEVEAALKSALGRLGDEARQLLRLHFVDGWNLEKIAQLHRLDRSNISRRVAAARRFVLQECMRELKERVPHLTASSVQALVRDLRSDLHVTLSAAFGSGGGSGG